MEFTHVKGNTYCIMGRSVITVYDLGAGKCVLIDTGHRKELDEILETLEKRGLEPAGVISTHTHHDHFGNAREICAGFGLPVILPLGEATACLSPVNMCIEFGSLSPGFVWQADVYRSLLGPVDVIIGPNQAEIEIDDAAFQILRTRGHSPDHISVITPDGVCHAGDCLMAGQELETTRFPYTCAYSDDIASKRRIADCGAQVCIVAHRGIIYGEGAIRQLVDDNLRLMYDCLQDVLGLLDKVRSEDELASELVRLRGIGTNNALKIKWMRRTLSAMLEYLLDAGKIEMLVEGGCFKYVKVRQGSDWFDRAKKPYLFLEEK